VQHEFYLGPLVCGRLALPSEYPDCGSGKRTRRFGTRNVSCGSLRNDRKGDDAQAPSRTAWVLGYVTAFNEYGSKPQGDISEGKSTEEIMAWIDKYCAQHPSDNLYSASAALVHEFRQKLGR
jgi:hypothetical protein